MKPAATGMLHHLELWVPDLGRAEHTWGWLLDALGYELYQQWPEGVSWRCGELYIVLEQSPARSAFRHDRHRPGLNHLAFHVSDRATVDRMVGEALLHGWRLLFADRHPYAGGEQHYAAYLEDCDGYEVELVAPPPRHGASLAESTQRADLTESTHPAEGAHRAGPGDEAYRAEPAEIAYPPGPDDPAAGWIS
jgi:catechol 2,3-dioxygenase-like lactoylglutathione lyase family enzyme